MLIILSKSPRVENFDSILEIAERAARKRGKVAILHIQDACIAASINEYCDRLIEQKIEIWALKADCEARGIVRKMGRNVRLIDYKEWVKLVMDEHKKIVSWTS